MIIEIFHFFCKKGAFFIIELPEIDAQRGDKTDFIVGQDYCLDSRNLRIFFGVYMRKVRIMCPKNGVHDREVSGKRRLPITCRLRVDYVSFTSRLRVVYVFYG